MTENTTTEDVIDITNEPADTPVEPNMPVPAEPEETPDEDPRGNREAAKYRKQLRDTQANLDQTAQHLESARAAVIAMTVDQLRVDRHMQLRPAAIRELNTEGVFAEDGTVNKEELTQRLTALYKERDYLFEQNMTGMLYVPGEGGSPTRIGASHSFESAFAPKNA